MNILRYTINTLLNSLYVRKKYIILPYNKTIYSILLLLQKYYVKHVYLIDK